MAFDTILAEAERSGVETLDLNGLVKIPEDASSVWIRLVLDKTIIANPEFQVFVNAFVSEDGNKWEHLCGFGCEGQKYTEVPEDQPSMRFRGESLKGIVGKMLRVELDVKNSKSIGVEVEIL